MAILTGTDNAETLTGTSAADTLQGGLGADTLNGGAGNDYFVADQLLRIPSLTDAIGGIFAPFTPAGSTPISGGSVSGLMVTIGALVDVMRGGAGDDTYVVNLAGLADVVTELADEGIDTVRALSDYTLGDNVENLELLQTFSQPFSITYFGLPYLSTTLDFLGSARQGVGNVLDNLMTGNAWDNALQGLAGNDRLVGLAGNDLLDGGAGQDILSGGTGNDTYIVDTLLDAVTELAGEGVDLVQSMVSLTLGANLENLQLMAAGLTGAGNAFANVITGSSGSDNLSGLAGNDLLQGNGGNDLLNGGSGNDTMSGGIGDDRYYVYEVGDLVQEGLDAGLDTVYSRISLTLAENLEKLYLLEGAGGLAGTGNALANSLYGNSGGNVLSGGAGADRLHGQAGNDTYCFARGDGADVVSDVDAAAGNQDTLKFLAGISTDQLWFRQSGNHLVIQVIGTADRVSILDWYSGASNRIEQFLTEDGGQVLQAADVQNLVVAMSAFSVPGSGQTTLTAAQHAALDGIIAASWN